jgi:hypothetical protein
MHEGDVSVVMIIINLTTHLPHVLTAGALTAASYDYKRRVVLGYTL